MSADIILNTATEYFDIILGYVLASLLKRNRSQKYFAAAADRFRVEHTFGHSLRRLLGMVCNWQQKHHGSTGLYLLYAEEIDEFSVEM